MSNDYFENLDELAKQYRIERFGYIATGYVKEQEEAVYRAASKILSSKYPDLIDEDEVYQVLSSRGSIFTIYRYNGDNRNGLFDTKRGNILIPYFIKRMTENLLHELTHKKGFLKADKSFLEMNPDIQENGTEIVASSALSIGTGKSSVLPYIWGMYPEKANSNLLTFSLLNQINLLCGGKNLEKTILKGHDYFKDALQERYGVEFYNYISSQISNISQKKDNYYSLIGSLGVNNERIIKIGEEFFSEIQNFEDKILKKEFDKRFSKINSLADSKKFLNELILFGKNRFQIENSKGELEDENLRRIFEDYKTRIEQNFGKTGIEFRKADIDSLPILEFEEDLDNGEMDRIEKMAAEFEKSSRARLKNNRKNGIKKIFEKIFGESKEETKSLPYPENTEKKDFSSDLIVKENELVDYKTIGKNKRENFEREKVD